MKAPATKNGACPGRLPKLLSRREMLRASALGFGSLALCGMMAEAQERTLTPGPSPRGRGENAGTHHRPRAKNVIFCFMDGGVSHVDSFDPKPELDRRDNQLFAGLCHFGETNSTSERNKTTFSRVALI